MNFKDINIEDIKYVYNNVYYEDEKLVFITPLLTCYTDINKKYDKYELKFKIDTNNEEQMKFYLFIKSLEANNKLHTNHLAQYKSVIDSNNILTFKVPFRYDKFELLVESNNATYLPTTNDIKKGSNVKCKIAVGKLWNYSVGGKFMCGCIMEIKYIMLF
jgi:hypothetical protein